MIGVKILSAAKKLWRKKEYKPLLISVRPTPICNARCVMCGNWKLPKKAIDFNVLEKALREAADLGVLELRITGGEPLMYPNLDKLVRLASELGLDVSVNTNGCFFSKKRAKELANVGVDKIFLSLDSPKPEVHDKIRGLKGCWNSACSASKNAADVGIKVITNTIIMKETYKDIPDLIRMSADFKFNELNPMYIIAYSKLSLTENEILEYNENIISEIDKAADETDIKIRTGDAYIFGRTEREIKSSAKGDYAEGRIISPCLVTLFTTYVTEDGDVFPCTESAYGKKFFIGNIFEKSFSEIVSSQEFRSTQEKAGKCAVCKHCKYEYIVFNRTLRS